VSPAVPPVSPRVTLGGSLALVATSLGLTATDGGIVLVVAAVVGLSSLSILGGVVRLTSETGPSEGWRAAGLWLLLAVGTVAVVGQAVVTL
jgi:hypothetical protein